LGRVAEDLAETGQQEYKEEESCQFEESVIEGF
jgi:hypothetical protein